MATSGTGSLMFIDDGITDKMSRRILKCIDIQYMWGTLILYFNTAEGCEGLNGVPSIWGFKSILCGVYFL